jgi:cytoskeletal protein CcmA (bactofilin family)
MEGIMFDKRKDTQETKTPPAAQGQERPVSATASAAAMGKTALIGAGIHVNGDISGTENLVIEGRVEGKIDLSGNQVHVGQSGKVAADIVAKTVKIDGALQGDVDGKERVVISKSGRVRGNITAPRVLLEDGAVFKGSIDINPAESAVAELPLKAKPAPAPRAEEQGAKESGYPAKS